MKTRKIIVGITGVLLFITLLSSCHRNTCPTFGKASVRTEVRS
jgi:hypothetical protein